MAFYLTHDHPQEAHRTGVNLRDARFDHAEGEADLAHGELFVVVERENKTLLLGQLLNRINQALARLGGEADEEWIFFGGGGHVFELLILFVLAVLGIKTAEFEAAEFTNKLLQLLEFHLHGLGDLLLSRRAAETLRED